MLKITVQVDGMMCGMCEAHVNDAVRKAFSVKKVTSSRNKGQTVILTENDIDEAALRSSINATGYKVTAVSADHGGDGRVYGLLYLQEVRRQL